LRIDRHRLLYRLKRTDVRRLIDSGVAMMLQQGGFAVIQVVGSLSQRAFYESAKDLPVIVTQGQYDSADHFIRNIDNFSPITLIPN
jgi:hypothetical protein